MCLDRITSRVQPDPRSRKAYKMFHIWPDMNNYRFTDRDHKGSFIVKRGVWLRAEEVHIPCADGSIYPTGFHVYAKNPGCLADGVMKVIPVYVSGVHTRGVQDEYGVLVARWLYVPKGKEKPPCVPRTHK